MNEFISLIKKLGLIGITNLLIGLGSIILLPILTKNFTIQEYGIWVQVIAIIGLIPYIASLGLSDSMIRFLASVKNKNYIKEEFYSIFLVATISTFFISILLLIFSNIISKELFDGNIYVAMILPLIVFSASIYFLLINYFRTFQMMKIYSLFLLLQSFILITLAAYFAVSNYSIFYAIIGILISYVIVSLLMFFLIFSDIGFKIPNFQNQEYLSFSLPNIPSNLSYWIVESSDRILIGIILGTAYVGYYAPSYAIGTVISIFSSPLYVLLFPVLSNYYDKNEINTIKTVLKYTLKYFLALALPSVFILSILSKQILSILTTPEIALNGYLIIPFVALSTLLAGLCMIICQVIILKKKTKIIGSIWIFASILNFTINLMIIPLFGILGAAIATLISYTTAFVLFLIYSRKYLIFDMDLSFTLKSIFASALIALLIYIFYPFNTLETLFIIGIGFTCYTIILLVLKGIKQEEISFFKNLILNND